MSQPRVLFVLSADFGEYVTASVFCRGQAFESHFALPRRLARYGVPGRAGFASYDGLGEVEELVERMRPDVVVLASGYLFPVNRIATPQVLSEFVARMRRTGRAVATTDPWLRIRSVNPNSRFTIHSVRQGGVDEDLSRKMSELQAFLERLFHDVPHLFAVPLAGRDGRWMPFFNPNFLRHATASSLREDGQADEWLFVLSKEDFVFLSGFERDGFLGALGRRIEELLSSDRNRLTLIGPAELGRFVTDRWPDQRRIEFLPFCDFDTFEAAIHRAKVVVYWNVLSSSLLYCLYYRVPPVFFGKGHQARVCEGLFEHAVECVFRGRPPPLIEPSAPLEPRADALIEQLEVMPWLDFLGREYARSPAPAEVVQRIIRHYARR